MFRKSIPALLVSTAVVIAGFGAASAGAEGGKTQDRLIQDRVTQDQATQDRATQDRRAPSRGPDVARLARMAALDAPLGPQGDQRMADAGPGPDRDFGRPPGGGPRGPHGPGEGPEAGPPPSEPHPPGPPHGARPDPLALARLLTDAETAIGIRAEQLNAWRDFTDALQASFAPPPRPPRPEKAQPEAAADKPPEPFAAVDRLARDLQARGKAGERLAGATETLKRQLSPEQLERVARLGPALVPPPPRGPAAPPPHGPDGGPPDGRPR